MQIRVVKRANVPAFSIVKKPQPDKPIPCSAKVPIPGLDSDAVRKRWLAELDESKAGQKKLEDVFVPLERVEQEQLVLDTFSDDGFE